jgi:hypothetical protein
LLAFAWSRNDIGMKLTARVGIALLLAVLFVAPAEAAPSRTYIVVLNGDAQVFAHRFSSVEHVYSTALHGFSVRLTASEATALARESGVDLVVPDTPVHASGEQVDPPSWGLDRIDQRDLPGDGVYRYPGEAPNVTAYVLDTGVRGTHFDFGDRVLPGYDFVGDDTDASDGNGHGTFVAGVIGGARYGVAKQIRIVPVKVLGDNGSGTVADVIAGIDWVTANAVGPAVANLSLGGPANAALDAAVRNSIASGVSFVVAAGGSAADAGNFSPARVTEALTVGASDMRDCLSAGTNRGAVVDVFAPGVGIVGPWIDGTFRTLSGSSFAAAHVAGALGLYALSSDALVAASTKDRLCGVPAGTANRLLYVG